MNHQSKSKVKRPLTQGPVMLVPEGVDPDELKRTRQLPSTGDGMVQIAYLHSEHVSHSWVESMRAMLEYDLTHGGRIARKPLNLRCGSGIVAHVRNYAARLFLDKTDHEWLLFTDTDMGFAADAVSRLLDEAADPVARPVVGALCFALMESAYDGMGGWRRTIVPTMYKLGTKASDGRPSFCYYGDYEPDAVLPVAGTGAAFLLIHRSALEKVRADVGNHWFDMIYDLEDDIVGEDIAFCGRLLKAGIVPVVHTGVRTTHHKEIWCSEQDYLMQESAYIPSYPDIPVVIDIEATVAALARREHVHDGMLKLSADLARYEQVIADSGPEVIVECGTHTGASARWLVTASGVEVITIDVNGDAAAETLARTPGAHFVLGDSTDWAVVGKVQDLVAGRRCMVVLDSDHSATHVAREIEAYGPLVSPGCYLVVEDTVYGYSNEAKARDGMANVVGSPLDAVAKLLVDNPAWSRDMAIERTDPVSANPAGWWIRNA
jgi:cephalosporin hydroxylase